MAEIAVRLKLPSKISILTVKGDISLSAFGEQAASALELKPGSFRALAGFPPAEMDLQSAAPLSASVSHNEVVRIDLTTEIRRPNEPRAESTPTKRGAKISSKKGGVSSSSAALRSSPGLAASGVKFGANIATLKPDGSAKKQPVKQAGARGSAASGAPAKRRRMLKFNMSSAEDVGDALLKAASGHGGDRKDKFLRSVFRRAVELEYDQAVAHSRVAAALGGRYTFEDTACTLSGEPISMLVVFPKGMGSRLMLEDRVDFLSLEKLKAVVTFVLSGLRTASEAPGDVPQSAGGSAITEMDFETKNYNRNMLKPAAMAGCSPRVFWSIVRHFGGDVVSGLSQLFPLDDWAWLSERPRKMSEKAAANARTKLEEAEARAKKKRKITSSEPEDISETVIVQNDEIVAIDGSSAVDDWLSRFVSDLHIRKTLPPILHQIFQPHTHSLDTLVTGLSSLDTGVDSYSVYESIIAKFFPEDILSIMGGSSLVNWACAESAVEAHLNWSCFQQRKTRFILVSGESSTSRGPNPNAVHKALTVWDFYDIIYCARATVMQQLWREFCIDVFETSGLSAEVGEIQTLFHIVTLLSILVDVDTLQSLPARTIKAVRPRDIALWRLSSDKFHGRLCHFLDVCTKHPRFAGITNYKISPVDRIKLACLKLFEIKSRFCQWMDDEKWSFFDAVIERKLSSEATNDFNFSINSAEVLAAVINNSISSLGNISNCQYSAMSADLDDLKSDNWIISCSCARKTKDLILARAAGTSFSADVDFEEDGSHLIGELVARRFGDRAGESMEYGVVIAFAPSEESSEHNEEGEVALWKIQYGDGDREDLEEFEILRAISDVSVSNESATARK